MQALKLFFIIKKVFSFISILVFTFPRKYLLTYKPKYSNLEQYNIFIIVLNVLCDLHHDLISIYDYLNCDSSVFNVLEKLDLLKFVI